LLVFDGESFWHVLHGTLPRIFGGQFIQFRKKAEDFCKRLHDIGYRLAFVFGNSPISAEAKADERAKQTLLHLTSFYRQKSRNPDNIPAINEIWPPCLRNVFPYYLRRVEGVTVLQSLMDKDLSVACYAKEMKAAAIVSNDSDMLIYAVCPVMIARGLVSARRRVVIVHPDEFCNDVNIPVERLPLLSVYLGNQETPITTGVVEASNGVIERIIRSGDRGKIKDAIEYVTNLEGPISIEDLARDIFQEVDEDNIEAVRISLSRYILRERDYEFDVRPIYKKSMHSPVIEPLNTPCVDQEITLFLEKIKKPVTNCDIILKSKAWRREYNIMHLAWPVPGSGIDDPEGLYRHIFEAHAYLLGKDHHLMVVPRFESDPIQLAEPAFRHISLKPATLTLPDGSAMPKAHELWISQDKQLQCAALVSIWEANDLDFQTLMSMVPASLCFLLVLHWVRRKANMEEWEVLAFLATHARMRHFTCDQIWRMNDMKVAEGVSCRSVVLANVFSKLMGRFLWMASLCGAPFKTVDLLPDLMFDGMIFQKKYEQAQKKVENDNLCGKKLNEQIMNQLVGESIDSPKDRDRVFKLLAILKGQRVNIINNNDESYCANNKGPVYGWAKCRPIQGPMTATNDHEPAWFSEWSLTTSARRKSASRSFAKPRQGPAVKSQVVRSSSGSRQSSRVDRPTRKPQNRVNDGFNTDRPTFRDRRRVVEGALPSYNFAPRNNFSSSEDSRRGKAPSSVSRVDGFGARGEGIYTEPSQFTDDAGYHTAATSQSRALSQNSQNQPKLQRKEDNNVLSFSDALASKCHDVRNCSDPVEDTHVSRHKSRAQETPQSQDDDGWGPPVEPHPREKKDRSSWDDVWEETPHIPRRLVATQAKKAAEKASREIVRKSRERSDKETDTWRDVENEKLNFFSAGPTSWENSQADESDNLAWSESEAEEPKAPSTKEALPSAKSEISYAQAAGARQQIQEANQKTSFPTSIDSDWAHRFQSSIDLRKVPEFVPASSRAASRCPSESAQSEYEYQSDTLSLSYRTMPRIPSRAGMFGQVAFPLRYPAYGRLAKAVVCHQPLIQVPITYPAHYGQINTVKKHPEGNQDLNGNEETSSQTGLPHHSYMAPLNVAMVPMAVVMPSNCIYNPLGQMQPPQQNL